MKESISEEEREYSDRIYHLRCQGDIIGASIICKEAIQLFNKNNFFYKIYGDLLFEQKEWDGALEAYLNFLERIKEEPEYFTNFAKFFQRINHEKKIDEKVFNQLAKIVSNKSYAYVLRKAMTNLIIDTYRIPFDLEQKIERVLCSITIEAVKNDYSNICNSGKVRAIIYLSKIPEKLCRKKEDKVNRYLLKKLEQNELYEQAIQWTVKILNYSNDPVIIRTLFRLCRKSDDYRIAEKYLAEKNIVEMKKFHIQYELVYYFNFIEDEKSRNKALGFIEDMSKKSLPISHTLFKFYMKFNMLSEAQIVQERIMNFNQSEKFQKVQKETEEIIWERLRTLVTEQEHTRQLLAISELIKGFSHELGQPITNIRYAIQLFYMKNKKGNREIAKEEKELLDSILKQTERVGKLLNRFSPIISSRSEKKYFNVYHAINSIFDELSSRLSQEEICFQIDGDKEAMIFGEELQFGQIFYNLIINAIYAINQKGVKGQINVEISKEEEILKIYFRDNGIGIPVELRRKIFEPFFSTKNKEVEEGGEGLGLFIVWNILKIFSGKLYVEEQYHCGAGFIIEICMKENGNV